MKNVVVVESPAKAKTIEKYLGSDFKVLATYGHICDLPSKNGSVSPDDGFAMTYETDQKSKKHLNAISTAIKNSDGLVLATDPDREGEAISWHILNYFSNKKELDNKTVQRVVFHEITQQAVRDAFKRPRDIDMDLVNAQQARRALDYLVGFTLSPVLWRKLPGSRSAGRVQSVALRLICEREQEVERFIPREYWSVEAQLTNNSEKDFTARLTVLSGKKLTKFSLENEKMAQDAAEAIRATSLSVGKIDRKQVERRPVPPFTTSTLQQEASRKLGFSARHSMQVAQELYAGIDIGTGSEGLITYMRTDSVNLSALAGSSIRKQIEEQFGTNFIPDGIRYYKTNSKNAQEAHEAIRPTDISRRPQDLKKYLNQDQSRLYELIWKRTMACQMVNARIDQTGIDINSADGNLTLRATGSIIAFDGFLRAYVEGRDDSKTDDTKSPLLPDVKTGESLKTGEVSPQQHFTEPPPRFNEATLVKKLEELGIGRPSTYASIIAVLQDRDYVTLSNKRFIPEGRGRLVTAFLGSFFERYVQYDFTADLEDQLDSVANGELDWQKVLEKFWENFSASVEEISDVRVREVLDQLNTILEPYVFPPNQEGTDPRKCGKCEDGLLSLKPGKKHGPFVGCSNYPTCKYTRQISVSQNGSDIASDGPVKIGETEEGITITLRNGPYGPYVQLGEAENRNKPKRVSLPGNIAPTELTLEIAIGLLTLPREIGIHPETGIVITATIGRFGPYIKHGDISCSLRKDDDVLTLGINRAVSLLAEPRQNRGRAKALRIVGTHPEDDKEIGIYDGKYGPYIKYKSINVGIPKNTSPEQITIDQAVTLLDEKAKSKKKTGRQKSPGRKKTSRKNLKKKS